MIFGSSYNDEGALLSLGSYHWTQWNLEVDQSLKREFDSIKNFSHMQK